MKLSYRERRNLYEHFHDSEIIPRHDAPAAEKAKEKETEEFKDRQLGMAIDYLKNQIAKTKSLMPKAATVQKD